MSKHPSKKQFEAMLQEWNKLEVAGKIRERNLVAETILTGVEGLLWQHVHRKLPKRQEADIKDAFNECALAITTCAIPNYNFKKARAHGSGFLTYAMWWARSAVSKFLDKEALIRVPTHRRYAAFAFLIRGEKLPDELQHCLPIYTFWDKFVSGDSDGMQLSEVMAPKYGYVTENEALRNIESMEIKAAVNFILAKYVTNERDLYILTGILNGQTLKFIGDKLGLSRERIRQIKEKNFAVIREKARHDPTFSWG